MVGIKRVGEVPRFRGVFILEKSDDIKAHLQRVSATGTSGDEKKPIDRGALTRNSQQVDTVTIGGKEYDVAIVSPQFPEEDLELQCTQEDWPDDAFYHEIHIPTPRLELLKEAMQKAFSGEETDGELIEGLGRVTFPVPQTEQRTSEEEHYSMVTDFLDKLARFLHRNDVSNKTDEEPLAPHRPSQEALDPVTFDGNFDSDPDFWSQLEALTGTSDR